MIRISSHAVSAHFIHEEKGMIAKRTIDHVPMVGDEIRLSGNRYYKVTRRIWVYDEEDHPFQRINIGLIDGPE
ncbi:hypothetical protein D7243_23000 [Stutzerimonas stutzeri]|nr:hypothetical protein [Stutzerimonas stutzeri]